MQPNNRAPVLRLVRGTLDDLERAAFEACFADAQTFETALDRLRAVRDVPSPRLQCVRPLAVVSRP